MPATPRMTEVNVFRVELICECGGKMRPAGDLKHGVRIWGPNGFLHRCKSCGHEESKWDSYPNTVYVEKPKT